MSASAIASATASASAALTSHPACAAEFRTYLSQGVGYGVVLGVGFFFAALMIAFTWMQNKFTNRNTRGAEEFVSASRSVKAGLICTGVVSAWTWSATLLQSATVAYQFGVSGPWWYAVGGTVQICLFSIIASKLKANASGATTFLEVVRVRFGKGTHLVFLVYALATNLIVCGILLLGGSATVSTLTGMNSIAANFLIPLGIVAYVIAGGLRSTFICDYTHTVILFIVIYIFIFTAYGTSPLIGSPSKMYDLLEAAAVAAPVPLNKDGSYLTMRSVDGVMFAVSTLSNGFSGVFLDQGYFQRAIASEPRSTTKAYMLGGLSWFSVPFAFATTLGLAGRALISNPAFPTYPYGLSASQQSAGLAAPAGAVALMGTHGAAAVLIVVFMAVTSASSAELIAVSSLGAIDVYKTYFRPKATGEEIVRVTHLLIAAWGVVMGVWSTILYVVGIDLGWLFYFMSVILGPAVVPIFLTCVWRKATRIGVLAGALGGPCFALPIWLGVAYDDYGQVTVASSGALRPAMSGSLAAIMMGGILSVGVSLLRPDDYDFAETRAIRMIDNVAVAAAAAPHVERCPTPTGSKEGEGEKAGRRSTEKDVPSASSGVPSPTVTAVVAQATTNDVEVEKQMEQLEEERDMLHRSYIRGIIYSFIASALVIIFPLVLFVCDWKFNKPFWTFWVVLSIIWVLCAGFFCIILPLWESRQALWAIAKGLVRMASARPRASPSSGTATGGRDDGSGL